MRHLIAYLLCIGFAAGVKALPEACEFPRGAASHWHAYMTTTFANDINISTKHLVLRTDGTLGTVENAEDWSGVSWYLLGTDTPPQSAEECADLDLDPSIHCWELAGTFDVDDHCRLAMTFVDLEDPTIVTGYARGNIATDGRMGAAMVSVPGLPVSIISLVRHPMESADGEGTPTVLTPNPDVNWNDTGASAYRVRIGLVYIEGTRAQFNCNGNQCVHPSGITGQELVEVCSTDGYGGPSVMCDTY